MSAQRTVKMRCDLCGVVAEVSGETAAEARRAAIGAGWQHPALATDYCPDHHIIVRQPATATTHSAALGFEDENPGDDEVLRVVRERAGKSGPEPTRWRDFISGARAQVDQINAARRDEQEGGPLG